MSDEKQWPQRGYSPGNVVGVANSAEVRHRIIEVEIGDDDRYVGHADQWCYVCSDGTLRYESDNSILNKLQRMYWITLYTDYLNTKGRMKNV